MQKTANYQLNQWVKSDRIQMEDFNSDNAKIDAALKGNADAVAAETAAREAASSLVKLMTAPLDANTATWQIDVSGIDLTQYAKLLIYPYLETENNQPIRLRVNGLTTGYSNSPHGSSTAGSQGELMDVNSGYNGNGRYGIREITVIQRLPAVYFFSPAPSLNSSNEYVIGQTPDLAAGVTHLDTLDFCLDYYPEKPILAGSKVHIYGLKL